MFVMREAGSRHACRCRLDRADHPGCDTACSGCARDFVTAETGRLFENLRGGVMNLVVDISAAAEPYGSRQRFAGQAAQGLLRRCIALRAIQDDAVHGDIAVELAQCGHDIADAAVCYLALGRSQFKP